MKNIPSSRNLHDSKFPKTFIQNGGFFLNEKARFLPLKMGRIECVWEFPPPNLVEWEFQVANLQTEGTVWLEVRWRVKLLWNPSQRDFQRG